ncbi:MAG: histidine phosphatase family protein [Rubrivivax sp.]
MAIILVRHGETALNAARVIQPANTPLSDRGLAQAEAVGRRFVGQDVAAIFSSDLARAWQTAEAISRHTDLPIEASALLQERNFGTLRGQAYDTLGFDPITLADAPPLGESARQFAERVAQAFGAMQQWHQGLAGDLMVVTHGLFIRVLLAESLRLPSASLDNLHLGNTCVNVFDAQAPHAVQLLNCSRHLDADTHDLPSGLSGG